MMNTDQAEPSLASQLHQHLTRTYLDYQAVCIAKGALTVAAYPSSYRSRRRQALGLLTAGVAHAVVRHRMRRPSIDALHGDTFALAIDSGAAAFTGVLSAQLISVEVRPVDVDWAIVNWLWSAGGASILGRLRRNRIAGALVAGVPMFNGLAGREPSLSPAAAAGLIFNWLGFATVSSQLVSRIDKRAKEIELASTEAAENRVQLADEAAAAEFRSGVLGEALETLAQIRSLLVEDRERAMEVARVADEHFRPWTREPYQPPAESPGLLLRGEVSTEILTALGKTELFARAIELGILGTNILIADQPAARRKWVVLGLAIPTANLCWVVWHRSNRHAARWETLVGDVLTATLVFVCERMAIGPLGRGQWSHPYAECIAGTMGPATKSQGGAAVWAIPLAVVTAVFGQSRYISSSRPRLRAIGDILLTVASTIASHRFHAIGASLAEAAERAATEVADVEAEQRTTTARGEAQFFVHDTLLQVLVFVQKREIDAGILDEWITDEERRIRLAIDGQIDETSSDIRESLDQLSDGMRRRGLQVKVKVPNTATALPIQTGRMLVGSANEALNNALRHADRPEATLTLERTEGVLRLAVRNPASGEQPIEEGTGLKGVRRRCEEGGFALSVQNRAGEFTFIIEVKN